MSVVRVEAVDLTRSGVGRTSWTRLATVEQQSRRWRVRSGAKRGVRGLAGDARCVHRVSGRRDAQQVEQQILRLGDDGGRNVLEPELEGEFTNGHGQLQGSEGCNRSDCIHSRTLLAHFSLLALYTSANMKIRESYPCSIREIENCWIPLDDGTRLAARIWLPEDAEQRPVPAILEYIPYRKRDFTAVGDSLTHPYFAGHGYASARVDIRGSGDSDGVLCDEYLAQEQDDALQVLRWLAEQPWCSGAVGMIGISWGGFSALQVAARRPPELKAIVTVCSTDDRYNDDVHYMGGCVLNDGVSWGSGLFTLIPRPPDPALVGERWREIWRERIEGATLPLCDLALASASGRLLETRLGVRGLPRDRMRGVCGRGLGGRLLERHLAFAHPSGSTLQGIDRAVDAYLSPLRRAATRHRLLAGGASLVGSLAQG